MKYFRNLFIVILSIVFFTFGCGKINSSNQPSKVSTVETPNKDREPLILKAKMVDNIAIPSDAEIISDKKDNANSPDQIRTIKLSVPASVYDVAYFYRTEMPKNNWKSAGRDNKREKVSSIVSFLEFATEKDEALVEISADHDNKSEVNIRIEENIEYQNKRTTLK